VRHNFVPDKSRFFLLAGHPRATCRTFNPLTTAGIRCASGDEVSAIAFVVGIDPY
jgi:hypothetical protein